MSARLALIRAMHEAGLRLDDAAVAADVAMRHTRAQRNDLILAARAAGLSYRQIAGIVKVDHALVVRVVTSASVGSPRGGVACA